MTAEEKKIQKMFKKLLSLHKDCEEDGFGELVEKLADSGLEFELKTEDSLAWIESEIEGYSEFPVVTQKGTLLLGGVVVYQWEMEYGCQMVDPTHTGTQGDWVPLRIDEQEHYELEEMLEILDIDIPEPDVPAPKPL